MIQRMAETGVVPFGRLPPDCATIDFFDVGDCAPGGIDHHDFERPVYVKVLNMLNKPA